MVNVVAFGDYVGTECVQAKESANTCKDGKIPVSIGVFSVAPRTKFPTRWRPTRDVVLGQFVVSLQ